MSESLSSFLRGTSALSIMLVAAAVLTWARPWVRRAPEERSRLANLLLLGVAVQCFHSIEEFVTGFHIRFPGFFGLPPWSPELFVAFNIAWIAIWIFAALGLEKGWRLTLLPTWFFALGMTANGIGHPLLSAVTGGYFPGLVTSPIVGLFGAWLLVRLVRATRHP